MRQVELFQQKDAQVAGKFGEAGRATVRIAVLHCCWYRMPILELLKCLSPVRCL